MSESREELIARRDALIGQLQGEWSVDTNWKSIRGKAYRFGLCLWGGGMILMCVIFPIMYGSAKINGTLNMKVSFVEFFGFMALFLLGISLLGSCCVMIQSWFYRKKNPIQVNASLLTWNKGKGFVIEKLHLESLSEVADTLSTGQGAAWFIRKLGPSATQYSKHMLVSKVDKNAPRITPGVFRDGLELIRLLSEVAALNIEINKLDEYENVGS